METQTIQTNDSNKKVLDKPTFNILYIGDGISRLSMLRGESVLRNFSVFYERFATTNVTVAPLSKLQNLTQEDLAQYNVIWLDNIVDAVGLQKITNIQIQLMNEIDPEWKSTLDSLNS